MIWLMRGAHEHVAKFFVHHTVYIYIYIYIYIEQNFGGQKTLANLANRHNSPSFSLANLANRHNSPSFFAKIPDEARKCRQALDSPKFFPPIFQNHNFAKYFYRQSFVLYGT